MKNNIIDILIGRESIFSEHISNFRNLDFLTQMKTQFLFRTGIAFSIFTFLAIILTLIFQYLSNDIVDPILITIELFWFILAIFSTYQIAKERLNLSINALMIPSFLIIWSLIFYEYNKGIVGLDTIALTFPILSISPILANDKKSSILFYTLANITLLLAFSIYLYINQVINLAIILEYLFDNIITYIIIATISYNIYNIYNQAITRSEDSLKKAKYAEENLQQLNESLEDKVIQRTQELNEAIEVIEDANIELQDALDKIEESNLELNNLNEQIAQEAQMLLSLNNKLSESEHKLKLANQTKDKFFSIIAHDLRNPFVPIINSSDLLLNYHEKINADEQQKLIKMINSSSKNVYALLENLLHWARTQNGSIEFYPENENIYDLFHKIIKIIYPQAEQKGIEFVCNLNNNIIVCYDVNMINTVIRNLLTNAIKFTPKGGKIEIGSLKSNELSGHTIFYVKDTGIGMDDATIENLFKLDQKTSRSGTFGETGTGLGLILCKEFIEKHNGNIWVESELGKGSTFYFSLPNTAE